MDIILVLGLFYVGYRVYQANKREADLPEPYLIDPETGCSLQSPSLSEWED